MTHEEKAREIVEGYKYDGGEIGSWLSGSGSSLEERIAKALASAEKKGALEEAKRTEDWFRRAKEEEFNAGKEKGREEGKNLLKACESAQHSIWKRVDDAYVEGWNEAISAAVKVAEEFSGDNPPEEDSKFIAESINKLKK